MVKIKKDRPIAQQIRGLVDGQVSKNARTLKKYSHDASLFEVIPSLVVYPKHVHDIEEIVSFVAENKRTNPNLSLTVRSGGTDMSGGAINNSIILDMTRHIKKLGQVTKSSITTQPGVYYRKFEARTLLRDKILPSYPASKDLCTIGGMLANNSGGEKSLVYGKTDRYVKQLKVVLRDGKEHILKPLKFDELREVIKHGGVLGEIYKDVFELVSNNSTTIESSKPKVSKNSTGYNIWDVWDGEVFDITKLIVGSQGTLGIITEATVDLVDTKPKSGMLVLFLPDLKNLGNMINSLLKLNPTSLESFDEHTLKFAIRFFFTFRKTLGFKRFVLLGLSFIPLLNKLLRYIPNLPKLIILVEFEGDSEDEIKNSIDMAKEAVKEYDVSTHVAASRKQEEKFWIMRRESFNLLRKNVKKLHTAPFIDDLIVPPDKLPEFMPKLTKILEKYELLYTVAGHVGDGNFHIIPLMDFSDQNEVSKIPKCLKEVTELVIEYDGSLSGEHNDGMIRGPFLNDMFPPKVLKIQKRIKEIFDPQNIFNPNKKTTADWDFSEKHIRKSF